MRKSEQVIYITLIDFLLQLLFLGLVLWVIFGNNPTLQQKDIDAVGGADKVTKALKKIKSLLDKNPGNDADSLLDKFSAILDPVGGKIGPALTLVNGLKDLMDKTGIHDPNALIDKIRSIIDEAGGIAGASEVPARVKDLMGKAGMEGKDPKDFLKAVEAIIDAANAVGGIDQVASSLRQIKDLMDHSGIKDPGELFAKLKAIDDAGGIDKVQQILERIKNLLGEGKTSVEDIGKLFDQLGALQQSNIDALGGLDKALELAQKAKAIAEKIGIDDPEQLAQLVERAKKIPDSAGKSDAPPYIILSETQGFSFDSGSSRLSPVFREKLETKVVESIQKAIDKYHVDLIEVIGHTDGQPVKRGSRQMDAMLESMAGQSFDPNRVPSALQGSNTDLGMLRALEVVKLLKQLRGQGKLLGINPNTGFRAYSSGQLTMVDGTLSNGQSRGDDEARRRIEIRLTRQGERIQE